MDKADIAAFAEGLEELAKGMFGFEGAQFECFLERFGDALHRGFAVAESPDVRTDGIEDDSLFALFGREREEELDELGEACVGGRDDEEHAAFGLLFGDGGIAQRTQFEELATRARAGGFGFRSAFHDKSRKLETGTRKKV